MNPWAWYLLGLFTLPAFWLLVAAVLLATAKAYGSRCILCGWTYHYGTADGMWILYQMHWQWHMRCGCRHRHRITGHIRSTAASPETAGEAGQ